MLYLSRRQIPPAPVARDVDVADVSVVVAVLAVLAVLLVVSASILFEITGI